jgi:hypothetical protein
VLRGLAAGLADQERGLAGVRRVPRPAVLATAGSAVVLLVVLAAMAVGGRLL